MIVVASESTLFSSNGAYLTNMLTIIGSILVLEQLTLKASSAWDFGRIVPLEAMLFLSRRTLRSVHIRDIDGDSVLLRVLTKEATSVI